MRGIMKIIKLLLLVLPAAVISGAGSAETENFFDIAQFIEHVGTPQGLWLGMLDFARNFPFEKISCLDELAKKNSLITVFKNKELFNAITELTKHRNDINAQIFMKPAYNVPLIDLVLLLNRDGELGDQGVPLLQLLIDNGANVNQVQKDTVYTPLDFAASFGCTDCIKLLLQHGAHRTATDLARARNFAEAHKAKPWMKDYTAVMAALQ